MVNYCRGILCDVFFPSRLHTNPCADQQSCLVSTEIYIRAQDLKGKPQSHSAIDYDDTERSLAFDPGYIPIELILVRTLGES